MSRPGGRLLPLVAAVLMGFAYLPLQGNERIAEPDFSLWIVLHYAFSHGLRFGRDIVFTYGPWGFLFKGFDPDTFPAALAASAFAGMVSGFVLGRLLEKHAGGRAASCAAVVATPLLIVAGGPDARFAFPAILFALAVRADDRTGALLLTPAIALAALVKFSFLTLAVIIMLLPVTALRRHRRWALAPLALICAVAIWWAIADQHLADIPRFLALSLEVARGYGDAAGGGELSSFAMAAVGALIVFVVATFFIERVDYAIVAAGIGWVLVKIMAVRFDAAHMRGGASLLLAWFFLQFVTSERIQGRISRKVFPPLATSVAIILAASAADAFADQLRNARALLSDRTILARRHALIHARVRKEMPLPASDKATFDAFASHQAPIVAAGRRYTPRPVFQGYAAWTERLAQWNGAHLAKDPPEFALLYAGSIDARYPTLDYADAFPHLLTRFSDAGDSGPLLLLRRSPVPRRLVREPVASGQAALGQWIEIPSSCRPCAFSAALRPSVRGRVEGFFFRREIPRLQVTLANGRRRDFTAPTGMIGQPFVISPFISSRHDVRDLMAGGSAAPAVIGFNLREAGRRQYDRHYRYSLERWRVE